MRLNLKTENKFGKWIWEMRMNLGNDSEKGIKKVNLRRNIGEWKKNLKNELERDNYM